MSNGFTPYEGEIKPLAAAQPEQKFEPYTGDVTTGPPTTPWSQVARGALEHLPSSAFEAGKAIVQPIIHPVDTAKNLLNLAKGVTAYASDPETEFGIQRAELMQPGSTADLRAAQAKSREELGGPVRQLAKFYGERYGSMEGFKKALSEDPVGIAMDIGTVLSVGEMAGAKVPLLAKLADPGRVATAAGKIGKAGEVITSETLGHLTGGGPEAVRQAVKAGFNREKQFIDALDGKIPLEQTVKLASQGVAAMRKQRGDQYRLLMDTVKADPRVLDFGKIKEALQDVEDVGFYKGIPLDARSANIHREVSGIIDAWEHLPPEEFHTAEGLDALKKKLGFLEKRLPIEDRQDRLYVGKVKQAVTATISDQAKVYSKIMKDYHEASDGLEEIERALSLNDKAMYDTGIRKLLSAFRNNANTNYGNRLKMIDKLEEAGAKGLKSTLAGAQMSSAFPRGLAGRNPMITALASLATGKPGVLGALPFESPKLMGRGAYKLGSLGREFSDLARSTLIPANMPPINPDVLTRLLYYGGQQSEGQ